MSLSTIAPLQEPQFTFPPDAGEAVARAYANADEILEYGSGGSTVLAARSTDAKVLSIETDKKWAADLNKFIKINNLGSDRVRVHWANIGPTGKWGYPIDQSRWRRYPTYALCPWEEFSCDPDVVLIDGRFRLSCLAATLINAKKHTVVLFDDYADRDVYRAAEKIIKPVEITGRLARFEIEPTKLDRSSISEIIRWFFVLK